MSVNRNALRRIIERMFNYKMIDYETRNYPEKLKFIASMLNFGKNDENEERACVSVDDIKECFDYFFAVEISYPFNFFFEEEYEMKYFFHPVEDVPPRSYDLLREVEKIYSPFRKRDLEIVDVGSRELNNDAWIVELYLLDYNCNDGDGAICVEIRMNRVKSEKNRIAFKCRIKDIQYHDEHVKIMVSSGWKKGMKHWKRDFGHG